VWKGGQIGRALGRFEAEERNELWTGDAERHEALWNRAVVKGHRGQPVAAGWSKLGAICTVETDGNDKQPRQPGQARRWGKRHNTHANANHAAPTSVLTSPQAGLDRPGLRSRHPRRRTGRLQGAEPPQG
jgi:hypothetical protein